MFIIPLKPIIKKWNKIDKSIFPQTDCKAILPFNGKLNSTLGLPKITKFIRNITYLNTSSLDVLIGILLGDGYFKKGNNSLNVRIGFKQSILNFPFMWKVFIELSHYCSSLPRFDFAILNGKKYGQLILETHSEAVPVLNELYSFAVYLIKLKLLKKNYFIICLLKH